ncbi:MAG TPA: gluconate 2-dehydrogenase subunit 3 family protein [Casimicrobiaceae bacterium]|nr:gluconate 2-dehydrogenase subunit 3 family protein [Casimicrobiaceae bacterium]
MRSPARRALLKAVAITTVSAVAPVKFAAPIRDARAAAPDYAAPAETFFTPAERAFIEAAIARIIPTDELGPGAKDAGVATFIDRQLAGPYGRAETWYMQGPWRTGVDEQGYQIKLTPAQLYRAAIRDVDAAVRRQHANRTFAELDAGDQDAVLTALEKRHLDLPNAPADTFFSMLVQNTVEGFLADPLYGGNRDFAGWKLIGFPGPRYNYVAEIEQFGKRYEMPYVSIAGNDTGVPRG